MDPHRHRLPVAARATTSADDCDLAIPMGWYSVLCSEITGFIVRKTTSKSSKSDGVVTAGCAAEVGGCIGVASCVGGVGVGNGGGRWSEN